MAEGKIVASYNCGGVTVRISDAALAGLSPAQLAANRRSAQRVAGQIAIRAMERGTLEGITPEEFRRRYGRDPYADG